MSKLHIGRWSAVLALVALSLPLTAIAGPRTSGKQYAIEFTCGRSDGSFAAPGEYQTAVSALNASGADAQLLASVALSVPSRQGSDAVRSALVAGSARTIDCGDILDGFFTYPTPLPANGLYKGFLRIYSSQDLLVSAHYTAGGSEETSSQVLPVPPIPGSAPSSRPDPDDVELCHVPPGNSAARHTIVVGAPAVSAHVGHGDYRGRCNGYGDDDDDDDDDEDDD